MMLNIVKEIRFGQRTSRFLILAVSFLFFAMLTPVMTKLVLPSVIKSQFPGMTEQELHAMLDMTQLGCLRSYMGDVFEIGSIIVAFTLCGLLAQEIQSNTLVLPLCSGKRFGGIVGAKMLVFGAALVLFPTAALLVDYLYAGLLFSFDVGVIPTIRGGLLQGMYMAFLLSCLLMWGAVAKRAIPAGFLALATVFGMHFLGSLLRIHSYLPSGLLAEAQQLAAAPAPTLMPALLSTVALIVGMLAIALQRLRSLEWNER